MAEDYQSDLVTLQNLFCQTMIMDDLMVTETRPPSLPLVILELGSITTSKKKTGY